MLETPLFLDGTTAFKDVLPETDCGVIMVEKPRTAGLCGQSGGVSPSLLYLVLKSNGSSVLETFRKPLSHGDYLA